MAPLHYTLPERAFIVQEFTLARNYAEVRRRFVQTYRRPGPDKKTVKRLMEKLNEGSLENRKTPGRNRTVVTPNNAHVI